MKRSGVGILFLLFAAIGVAHASTAISVDCGAGQSLNSKLAGLSRQVAYTVTVTGTCSEYVQVVGFDNLTLKAATGAAIAQPTTAPPNLVEGVLSIESSRSVTVQGFSIQADTTLNGAVVIEHGSSDIRLRNLTITGGGSGVVVDEHSQVSIAYVTVENAGFAPLGIYDFSDVHIEHCALEESTGTSYHIGIFLGASHVTMYATTITNMQVGIDAYAGSVVDLIVFTTYYPTTGSTNVTIATPAAKSYNGVVVDGGSSLNIGNAKLMISKPGQSFGGTTGGILVSDGATLKAANGYLQITSSQGQGIVVLNNSHATLNGATVTSSAHGGLLALNLSSIDMAGGTTLSNISGNSVDLFCDSVSAITGTANISGAPTTKCTNLLATETAPLP
jgi:hypothetical protein